MKKNSFFVWLALFVLMFSANGFAGDKVTIALNYPETGPYKKPGLEQWRAAELARLEINAQGGILGREIEFRLYDSRTNMKVTTKNVIDAIDNGKVQMVFGGLSSAVAVAAARVCKSRKVLYFGATTSTVNTCEEASRYNFRSNYNAWMIAKCLANYMRRNFKGKKYFYITADYTWGWTTEASVRRLSGTEDKTVHKGIRTPFPSKDFKRALKIARRQKPDVLVLVLFGQEMATAIRQAAAMGMKDEMQIVVPALSIGAAELGTPAAMEGVVGTVAWAWNIPLKYHFKRGNEFVTKFTGRFNRYPGTIGYATYTNLHEYCNAVERAGTFKPAAVIRALEGHEFQLLKDKEKWRSFDHQLIQTVYLMRCKPADVVLQDRYNLDYFEVIGSMPGYKAVRTRAEWNAARRAAGLPLSLEKLPGE